MFTNAVNHQENHKCENCEHIEICKWLDDMKMKQEEVSKIPKCKGLTPVSVNVTCQKFKKKQLRQDGLPGF